MTPWEAISRDSMAGVQGVATDLDGTLTTGGKVTKSSIRALEALEAAGIPCVVATGRPVGWATVLARLLPVRAVVAENGGAWAVCDGHGVRVAYAQSETDRTDGMTRSIAMAERLGREHPGLARVSDWTLRATDVAMDIGERCLIPRETVAKCLATIRGAGLYGVASTVHLHIGARIPDKTEGLLRALGDIGLDAGELTQRWVFVGDSPNDEGPFGTMKLSVGVSGVRRFELARPPKYVTRGDAGEGFAEVVSSLLAARWTSGEAVRT